MSLRSGTHTVGNAVRIVVIVTIIGRHRRALRQVEAAHYMGGGALRTSMRCIRAGRHRASKQEPWGAC